MSVVASPGPVPGQPALAARPATAAAPSSMPCVLYIGQNPGAGTGSPVIVLRHLRRFAQAGWTVRVVADYGGDYSACRAAGWAVTPLSHRRWWWPPYRGQAGALRWLRLRILAHDVAAAAPAPDVILAYIASHTDFSARLATHVARVTGAPLHFLVHDDPTAFPGARGHEAALLRSYAGILQAADACWFVSPELADRFPALGERRRLLYPIPEGWGQPAAWSARAGRSPRIYYAGHVWPEQLPLLGRIAQCARQAGGEFAVIAKDSPLLQTWCQTEGVRWHAPFPTNPEVLAHLTADASAVVVSYADSVGAMPWCATSFPSKLVEYCHLGLPIAIVAPAESSVARWAQRTGFPANFAPANLAPLQAWFAGLQDRPGWETAAAVSLQFARTEFDPQRIQADLANALQPGTERRAA